MKRRSLLYERLWCGSTFLEQIARGFLSAHSERNRLAGLSALTNLSDHHWSASTVAYRKTLPRGADLDAQTRGKAGRFHRTGAVCENSRGLDMTSGLFGVLAYSLEGRRE